MAINRVPFDVSRLTKKVTDCFICEFLAGNPPLSAFGTHNVWMERRLDREGIRAGEPRQTCPAMLKRG